MEGDQFVSQTYTSLGLDMDSNSHKSFFSFINSHYGHSIKNYLKQWIDFQQRLAELASQWLFLLCSRSNNILPRHIINLSKKFSYVKFQNKKCKSIFDHLNNYFAVKLLIVDKKRHKRKSYGKLELDPQKTNPDFDRRT